MYSKAIFCATVLSSVALAQIDLAAIPDVDAGEIESLIEDVIPTEYKTLIPSVTAVVDDIAAYVTSLTAQPDFSAALAALETSVPLSVVEAIGENPEEVIMDLATGTTPSWFTAIPTDVVEYLESIGEEALSIVEGGTGISSLPGDVISEVEASASSAYGAYATGGYPYPYPYPTGSYYGTGTAASYGFPAPTGNSSIVPYKPTGTSAPFLGAAPPRSVAMGAAAMVAGVASLFLL